MNFNFDANDLTKIIEDASKKTGGRSKDDYTNVAYLPEGVHSVSIFLDPEREIFRQVAFHKFDKSKIKSHCTNHLNMINSKNPSWPEFVQSLNPEWKEQGLKKLPPCKICLANDELKKIDEEIYGDPKKGKSWLKKLGVQYNHLVYMNLYRSNNPGEYWKPDNDKGTPYAVVGSSKLRTAILGLLESLQANSASYITNALNPTIPSPPLTLKRTGGTQGGINISFSPEEAKPAIISSNEERPSWWRPLKDVFMSSEFDIDTYNQNVELAEKALEEYKNEVGTGVTTVQTPKNTSEIMDQKKSNVITEPFQLSKEGTSNTLKVPEVNSSVNDLHFRDHIEEPKELTPTEEKMEESGELKNNQRLSLTGEIVTLPDYAVERDCWTKFESTDALCAECPASLECCVNQ